MADTITVSEWIAELEKLEQTRVDDGFTTTELIEILGKSRETIQRFLEKGFNEGWVIRGQRKISASKHWSGRARTLTVYHLCKGGRP